MKKKIFSVFAVLMFIASTAYAHEKRAVGEYEFVVGFVNEPAFSGGINGIDLRILKNGEPAEGLESNLNASVQYADDVQRLELAFKPKHKQPGAYAAHFLPSKPGKYTFYITGKIGDKEISEVFVSGEKFHDVNDSEAVKWPK